MTAGRESPKDQRSRHRKPPKLRRITAIFRLRAALPLWAICAGVLSSPFAPALAGDLGRSQSDIDTERFLSSAEVVESEDVGEGITEPLRVTLRQDGVERQAIFKTVDREIDQVSRTTVLEPNFTDKYTYEVAAYRIDRLIGMGLVPATVLRTLEGEEGSLQLWIEDITTMDKALAEHGDAPIDNFDLLLERLMLTYVLDALIYNVDRNHTNILVDFEDDRFHPIDHSRAFRLHKKIPPMKDTEIKVPQKIAARLRVLDLATLEMAVGDLLDAGQVKAIDKRRQTLIKELEKRGLM